MISYILPIRNEINLIKRMIDSILKQNHIGHEFEILIADGMSTDGTREKIDEYNQKIKEVCLINNLEGIVSSGFNRALSICKGSIIIRVDGHSEIAPDFVENCIAKDDSDS